MSAELNIGQSITAQISFLTQLNLRRSMLEQRLLPMFVSGCWKLWQKIAEDFCDACATDDFIGLYEVYPLP